jgi:hypothetical protein
MARSKVNFGMGGRGQKSVFITKNPSKYIGDYPIISRSSWELKMMQYFDTHPNVLFWASESLAIPYINCLTKKMAKYYPDFLVIFKTKDGKQIKQIIEVKPLAETVMENAKSNRDKAAVVVNMCKWGAAQKFAKDNGMSFRIVTEHELFGKM